MIAPSAVKRFLRRPLRRLSGYTTWSREEILDRLDRLDPQPHFHTRPYRHQLICFYLCLKYPTLFLNVDMGLGKTKVMLDLFSYLKRTGEVGRMLVLVNTVVNIETWEEQAREHTPDLECVGLHGEEEKRREILEGDADVVIATYMGWVSLCCDRKTGKRKSWNLNGTKVRSNARQFDFVAYDESTALKNPHSLTFRIARRMSRLIESRYALTGTPCSDPSDLWAQFYAIDRGETLGPTLGLFRAAFFKATERFWVRGFDYHFKHKMTGRLIRMMSNRSIQFRSEDCLDLPEQVFYEWPLTWPTENAKYYKKMVREIRKAKGNWTEMDNVYIRMRYLASGFLVGKVGDERHAVRMPCPKVDALFELIEEAGDEKVVVFHDFILTGDRLEDELKKKKLKYARLYSRTKDKKATLRRFKKSRRCRILLVNNQSGALGLNLQVARYVVFYESPVPPIIRAQAEKRCHRPGQTERVFYYDLYIRGSVEQKILRALDKGLDFMQALKSGSVSL